MINFKGFIIMHNKLEQYLFYHPSLWLRGRHQGTAPWHSWPVLYDAAGDL